MKKKLAKKNWTEKKFGRKKIWAKKNLAEKNLAEKILADIFKEYTQKMFILAICLTLTLSSITLL